MTFDNTNTPEAKPVKLFANPRTYKFNVDVNSVSDYARGLSSRAEYDEPGYGAGDFVKDTWNKVYEDVQLGEMQEEGARMVEAKQNIESLETLMNYKKQYDALKGYTNDELDLPTDQFGGQEYARWQIQHNYNDALNHLKQRGVFTEDGDKVDENWIKEQLESNKEKYAEHEKNYFHNYDQYKDRKNKVDVSQYFTKKSNEQTIKWGNFLYKSANTMGYSLTTPIYQLRSMLAAAAAYSVASGATGAALGSGAGPVGTAVSVGIGAVAGATAGFFLGSKQAREYESQMEQTNGLIDRITKEAEKNGVDTEALYKNFRDQLNKKGIDTSAMDDRTVMLTAISTEGITSDNLKFNKTVSDAYDASRIIYDKNMALGASDLATELLYALPLGKVANGLLKPMGRGVQRAVGRIMPAFNKRTPGNKIYGLLGERFNMGANAAISANAARNRTTMDLLGAALKRAGVQAVKEGTEEGAQQIIQYEYLRGDYDNMVSHDNMWQDLSSGNMFGNIAENVGRRWSSAMAALHVTDVYKDDQEMYESMLIGALMPFTDPRSAVRNTIDAANVLKQLRHSKEISQAMFDNMANRDEVARSKALLDLLDKRAFGVDVFSKIPVVNWFTNNSTRDNYMSMLDRIQTMMKANKDGKLPDGFDTSALTEDGSVPTEADIDEYFANQRKEFDQLWGSRKKLTNKLKASDIELKDFNTFIALRNHFYNTLVSTEKKLFENAQAIVGNRQGIINDTSETGLMNRFRAQAKANGVDLTDVSNDDLFNLFTSLHDFQGARTAESNAFHAAQAAQLAKEGGAISQEVLDSAEKKQREAAENTKKQKGYLEKFIKSLVDKHEGLDSDALNTFVSAAPLISEEFLDNEQYRGIIDSLISKSKLEQTRDDAMRELREFDNVSSKAKESLEKYKQSLVREDDLAQAAQESIKTGHDFQVDESATKNYTDLTAEQVEQKQKELSSTLDTDLKNLNDIFDAVPADENNPIYKYIVEPLLSKRQLFQNRPINYARYIAQNMRNMMYRYADVLKGDSLTEEQKAQMKQLQDIANVLHTKADQLNQLAVEQKAKAKRHSVKLEATNQIYRDADGNEYTIDTSTAQYSENEGLVLDVTKLNADRKELEEKLETLQKKYEEEQKKLAEYQKDLEEAVDADDISRINQSIINLQNWLDPVKQEIEATKKKLNSKRSKENMQTATMTGQQLKQMGLVRTDNKGVEHKLDDKLDDWLKDVSEKIADNKRHRNAKSEATFVEGDVTEYGIDDRGKTYLSVMKERSDEERRRPKFIPLGTAYGAKIAGKLNNPYHSEKYWTGKVFMPYQDAETAGEYLANVKHKDKRIRAVVRFHEIGRALYNLRDAGKEEAITDFLNSVVDLYLGKITEVKIGTQKLTSKDFKNMVDGLPVVTTLFQPRAGKRPIILFNIDNYSENQLKDDNLTDTRIETVTNLLLSYKESKSKQKASDVLDEENGLSEAEVEARTTNGLRVEKGDVHVYYNGFEYNIISERDTSDDIFNVGGESMTAEQLKKHFEEASSTVLAVAVNRTNDIAKELTKLRFADDKIKKLLEKGNEEALKELIEGVLKYADGAIDASATFAKNYITKHLGAIDSKLPGKTAKDKQIFVAKKLMDLFANMAPNQFLSYGVNEQTVENTPPVNLQVEDALRRGYFQGPDSIVILQNGERVSNKNTAENVEEVTQIFERMEELIHQAQTADDYIDALHSEGLTFGKDNPPEGFNAEDIIRDYFNNRKFGRLATPSNIVNAITMASSTPLNGKVNYGNLHRRSRHQNDKISTVKPLHLLKGEDGKYYFSLRDWAEKNVPIGEKADADSEYAQDREEISKYWDDLIAEVNSKRTKKDILALLDLWVQQPVDPTKSAIIDEDTYNSLVKTNKKDEKQLIQNNAFTKGKLQDFFEAKKKEALAALEKDFLEKKMAAEAVEDEILQGHTKAAVTLAYGSFRDSSGHSSIVYFDADGNKHTMQSVNGRPGAIYLMLPSFLSAQRTTKPISLNVRRFTKTEAGLIASLLVYAKEHIDEYLPNGQFKSEYGTVTSDGTVREILDSLIYTGTDTIENNPTAENYARLLQLDKGYLRFGEDENDGTAENIEELADFIMQNKTFRIDMSKASSPNSIFGFNLTLQDAENKELLKRERNQNYIAGIIDEGTVLTDLNHEKIFGNPTVRCDANLSWTMKGGVAKANAKTSSEKKKGMMTPATPQELEEQIEKENATNEDGTVTITGSNAKSILSNYMNSIANWLTKRYTKISDGVKTVKMVAYENGKPVGEPFVTLVRDNDDAGNFIFSITGENAILEFAKRFTALARKKSNAKLVPVDENGEIIKIDGKIETYGKGFAHFVFDNEGKTKTTKAARTTQSSEGSNSQIDKVLEVLTKSAEESAKREELLTQLLSIFASNLGVAQQGTQQVVTPTTQAGPIANFAATAEPSPAALPGSSAAGTADEIVQFLVSRQINIDDLHDDYSNAQELIDELEQDEKLTDKQKDDIRALFGEKPSQPTTPAAPATQVAVPAKLSATAAATAGFNFGALGNAVVANSIPQEEKKETKSTTKAETKKPAASPTAPVTDEEVISKITVANLNEFYKANKSKITANETNPLRKLITLYLQEKFGINDIINSSRIVGKLISQYSSQEPRIFAANYGQIFPFFSDFVEKEDFEKAYEATKQILGKDFDLSIDSDTPHVWDNSRRAMVYVFGQCAASGIRLFRDASGKIAKGSMYHEAFHRVSLFILSEQDRKKMYEDARKNNPELQGMADRAVEEWLADRFADFVLDAQQQKQGKYYDGKNFVTRAFQKLVDKIRSIIRRLTDANLTPRYTDMNKLFKNMYSGRYAYAKVTKRNAELFQQTYFDHMPYLGFMSNGKEIAESATQFENIRRHLLAMFIEASDVLKSTTGRLNVSVDTVRQNLQAEYDYYSEFVRRMDSTGFDKTPEYKKIVGNMTKDQIIDGLVKVRLVADTYGKILRDENWEEWSKILKRDIDREFGLELSREQAQPEDANIDKQNTIADEDGVEDNSQEGDEKGHFSSSRDGLSRDIYKETDMNVKMLLWDCCVDNKKYNNEGLAIYVDPKEMYSKLVDEMVGVGTIDEFKERLKNIAAKAAVNGDNSLQMFYTKLTKDDTSLNMLNKVFVGLVKYTHNFENNVYTSKDSEKGGYDADVRNSTQDTITTNLKTDMSSSMSTHFLNMKDELKNGDKLKVFKKGVKEMVNLFNKTNISDANAQQIVRSLKELFNVQFTGDFAKDTEVIKKLHKNKKGALNVFSGFADGLRTTDFTEGISQAKLGQVEVVNKLNTLFNDSSLQKAKFAEFCNEASKYMPKVAKTASQKGPENTKIFTIGQYNFITKMVSVIMKTRKWLDKQLKNPYAFHSLWRDDLERQGDTRAIKFMTKLATVLNDDYETSRADRNITGRENMLNLFSATLKGEHNIPSLANKKFAGCIQGLQMFNRVLDEKGYFNPAVVETFVNYLADEILAICDAIRVKRNFIEKLNETLRQEGKNVSYTLESFSALTATQQEAIFRNSKEAASLLRQLVSVYHFKSGAPEVIFNEDGHIAIRKFHIDLTSSVGTQFRHFKEIGKKIAKDVDFDKLSEQISQDMHGDGDRSDAIRIVENIAKNYTDDVQKALRDNIEITIKDLMSKDIVFENAEGLTNVSLPENLIKSALSVKNREINSNDLYRAISLFTVQNMSDMIEFEKLISGDIGFHKNITSVNKRYSGLVSTEDMTSDKSTLQSEWDEDHLFDSETFTSLTLNTTTVVNKQVYIGDMYRALGEYIVDYDQANGGFYAKDGSIEAVLDYKRLLDENGNLKETVKNSMIGKQFITLREKKLPRFMNGSEPISDEALAIAMVAEANKRFSKYLGTDPTDAQVYISAKMFRQLQQRRGNWTDIDEARYNLLEHYDTLPQWYKNNPELVKKALALVGADVATFEKEIKKYENALKKSNQKAIQRYKGYILGITEGFDTTSLKYVYYGDDSGRSDKLVIPMYDKMSLSAVFRIFADGHEMSQIRQIMDDRNIDYVKFESATKSAAMPCFEAYDANGNIDTQMLMNAPTQMQYFALLGRQLNTDPHKELDSSLLTQFMKIAMTDVEPEATYRVAGKDVSGRELQHMYRRVLDELTFRGAAKFKKSFGISEDGKSVNKEVFMDKLRDMMVTQDVPAGVLDALRIDDSGDFTIHPAALPNINAIQSRIISEMGKTIITTAIPGQPAYQVSSFGYDNLFDLDSRADKHLYMPGELDENNNLVKRMQVRLSINVFSDVIKMAKKSGMTLDNFEDQKKFILENKDLFAMSYRVPTQGQDSTIPIEIVDILPSQQGGIIQFPSGITTQTGSDFDIDKMYLARFNYEVVNGKLRKVKYNFDDIDNDRVRLKQTDEQLQNMLLDMYQAVLTSPEHYVAVNTPLDVSTDAVKNAIGKSGKDPLESHDLYYTNPSFQTAQKVKNAGSDDGIAPMALNSVFRYWAQVSGLNINVAESLKALGLTSLNRKYDKNGQLISDSTSAQINAFVDAVKDNYIGKGNVNQYTFDVTSLLTTLGFGDELYAFLMQPIIKRAAENYNNYKLGKIGVPSELAKGDAFLEAAKSEFQLNEGERPHEIQPGDLSVTTLKDQIENPSPRMQQAYLKLFLEIKNIAQFYRQGLTCAQVDTKKYGISAPEMISFIQKYQMFNSDWNYAFSNPTVLFDNTWLGAKYDLGVEGLFDALSNVIFEFSDKFREIVDDVSEAYGIYGQYNSEQLKVIANKVKTVYMNNFFNNYLKQRYPNVSHPLFSLVSGEGSVPQRFKHIQELCMDEGIGSSFFSFVKCNYVDSHKLPQFMIVDQRVKNNNIIRSNVQNALIELFQSNNAEVRQWANDLAVYMYYISGGSDANAGGRIKTTLYDLIPPQYFGNIGVNTANGVMALNEYVETYMMDSNYRTKGMLDHIQKLIAVSDDTLAPIISTNKSKGNMVLTPEVPGGKTKGRLVIVGKTNKRVTAGGFGDGVYLPYIKVRRIEGVRLYKIIGVTVSTAKSGNKYMNPIYARVQNFGYSVQKQRAFSIRADGYVTNDGKIESMLWTHNDDLIESFEQLKELVDNGKIHINGAIYPVSNGMVDFAELNQPTRSYHAVYAAINKADSIAYVDGDVKVSDQAMRYAKHIDKNVHKVLDVESPSFGVNEKVFLTGDYSDPRVIQLVRSQPNTTFFISGNNIEYLAGEPNVIVAAVDKGSMVFTQGDQAIELANRGNLEADEDVKGLYYSDKYNRDEVEADADTLYVYTDNTDKTSSAVKGGAIYGSKNNTTSAVIRGLPNAFPITTMKYFYKLHNMRSYEQARFTDKDAKDFGKLVEKEFNNIYKALKDGKFKRVVFPGDADGLFNSKIANISKERTPELYGILQYHLREFRGKVSELNLDQREADKKGEQIKKHCKS